MGTSRKARQLLLWDRSASESWEEVEPRVLAAISKPWVGWGGGAPVPRGRGRGKEGRKKGIPQLAVTATFPPAPRHGGGRKGGGMGCGPHLPISRTIKTTFKFFSPGLISFIKSGGSLTPFILRQVRLRLRRRGWKGSGTKLPTLPGQGPGQRGDLGRGWQEKGQKAISQGPRKPAQVAEP